MIKVTLIGHDTRNANHGVGALTVSEVDLIRRIAKRTDCEVEITILIGHGGQSSIIQDVDVIERVVRPLRKPVEFYRAVREADLVIDISGGDSFADIYGDRRIFQILLQKYMVHLAGRPLVMAPQTIGPFAKRLWRQLAKGSIRRCSIVATRDDKSTGFLREIGITRDVVEATDVALRLPYDPPAPRSSGSVRIGLNVSGLLMGGGYTGKNEFGLKADYSELIRTLIRWFLDHPDNCEVHLVPHVFSTDSRFPNREDDAAANDMLAKEFPDVVAAPRFATPSEAKSYIAGLDFFAGARMHACIAAFSSGVPVVPMAYSRKFEGLFGTLGYMRTVDCTSEAAGDLLKKLQTGYAQRAQLADEVARAYALGRQKLEVYEKALEAKIAKLS